MSQSRGQIFDYAQHNLCGGKAHSMVHSTRKPELAPKSGPEIETHEGQYTTRDKREMSWLTFRQNRQWAIAQSKI